MSLSLKTIGLAILSLVLVGAVPRVASAQNAVEIFYQYQHLEDTNFPLGAGVQIFHPVSMTWGIVGGADWSRKSESEEAFGFEASATTTVLSFFVGPRLTRTTGENTVFGQVGIGAARASSSADLDGEELFSDSSTEMMLGFEGGVKGGLTDTLGYIAQAGYRRIFSEGGTNAFRLAVGISASF